MLNLKNREPNMKIKAPYTRRAFSFLELMIVIATIAILLSLLYPSFARAYHLAKSATCLSKLKQLNMLTTSYATSNRSNLPQFSWEKGDFQGVNVWDVPLGFCRALNAQGADGASFSCSYNFSVVKTDPYWITDTTLSKTPFQYSRKLMRNNGDLPQFKAWNGAEGKMDLAADPNQGKRYLCGLSYWSISFSDGFAASEVYQDWQANTQTLGTGFIQTPRLSALDPSKALWTDNARSTNSILSNGWYTSKTGGASLHEFRNSTNIGVVLGDGSGSLKKEATLSLRHTAQSKFYSWY
jgi:prepilin-type N-terminal cleavage/methylation domain-containing protein